jgi:hypothetical protein
MALVLLFILSGIGTPSVESYRKGVFPHKDDLRVYIELSKKMVVLLLVLFQQSATTNK